METPLIPPQVSSVSGLSELPCLELPVIRQTEMLVGLSRMLQSLTVLLGVALFSQASDATAQGSGPAPANTPAAAPPAPPSKFKDFTEVTRGLEHFDGLFALYKTNETLYGEIKPPQLDQPFIAPMAIARGLASAGVTLNFGDEWILVFHRSGDKVQLIRRNIHYKAPDNTPLQKAVKQNYIDSVLMALPIVSINPGTQGLVIDFSQIFMSDFAQLGLGGLDRNRSNWAKIKAFPNKYLKPAAAVP